MTRSATPCRRVNGDALCAAVQLRRRDVPKIGSATMNAPARQTVCAKATPSSLRLGSSGPPPPGHPSTSRRAPGRRGRRPVHGRTAPSAAGRRDRRRRRMNSSRGDNAQRRGRTTARPAAEPRSVRRPAGRATAEPWVARIGRRCPPVDRRRIRPSPCLSDAPATTDVPARRGGGGVRAAAVPPPRRSAS